ncbi:uncharacterized protein B0I36DRAFT_310644 [Microdochium trichocladiopsis]|uniref:Uncharacterized protein n=1 Tax=Microdochium trichocladiopsis TaxID=1682393 RepID=A0A9P9BZS6_9PEZI|nr:uncharacterized protein B0I36DRAFT_310644 [Microdochium trichocladiopsis]KAH7040424.1 hypothetical protein B0I36DRAFT_310644 [Microdochium trichocladiopsis]
MNPWARFTFFFVHSSLAAGILHGGSKHAFFLKLFVCRNQKRVMKTRWVEIISRI